MNKDVEEYLKNPVQSNAIKIFGTEAVTEGKFRCKSCGKIVPASKLKIFDTKILKGVMACLCDDCWNAIHKLGAVMLVCVNCKEVRKIMEPFKNTKTGFEFKPGHIYHIEDCPVCNKEKYCDNRKEGEAVPTVVIEEAIYDKKLAERNQRINNSSGRNIK